MTISRVTSTGAILALAALVPLDCRQAFPEKASPVADQEGDASAELSASQVTDEDIGALEKKWTEPAPTGRSREMPWEAAGRIDRERIERERRTRADADLQLALRTDTPIIVPSQPFYVTIKVTNKTNEPRKLDDLLNNSEVRVLVARRGEQPSLVDQASGEGVIMCGQFSAETVVPANGNVFFDRMLTKQQIIGARSSDPAPPRIFSEPGEYNVYAALVYTPQLEVLRSEPLVVTVRKPTEAEVEYVEFFSDGRQIPPHYGFNKVDEEAFDKLRGRGPERVVPFQRKVDAETIDKVRSMLAIRPDPPVADDMRYYLMMLLFRSSRRFDDRGRVQGTDHQVIAAAAQQYLEIAPERKQLRRRGVDAWYHVAGNLNLDQSQPILQVLASWKASSPFYEDEVESQAALDQIIDKIEARLAQEARQRANAPRPQPKLPTD